MNLMELSGLIPVSALYIGLHGLMAVVLANFVLYARLRTGKVPAWQPDAALRVQANFIENVPIALIGCIANSAAQNDDVEFCASNLLSQ